jgi:hypothetical protein
MDEGLLFGAVIDMEGSAVPPIENVEGIAVGDTKVSLPLPPVVLRGALGTGDGAAEAFDIVLPTMDEGLKLLDDTSPLEEGDDDGVDDPP